MKVAILQKIATWLDMLHTYFTDGRGHLILSVPRVPVIVKVILVAVINKSPKMYDGPNTTENYFSLVKSEMGVHG